MIPPRLSQLSSRRMAPAFSLVELLMTISLIVIMVGLGAKVFRDPSNAHQVPSAVSQSSTAFSAARASAITKNARTLILINNDTQDAEKYRRQILTVQADKGAGGEDVWRALGNPILLPQGTYFDRDRSLDTSGNAPETMNFNYPGDLEEGSGPEWLAYSFAPNGASEEPGARFIIARGTFNPVSREFVAVNAADLGGFVLRRVGHVTMFRDSAQILQ